MLITLCMMCCVIDLGLLLVYCCYRLFVSCVCTSSLCIVSLMCVCCVIALLLFWCWFLVVCGCLCVVCVILFVVSSV